MSRTKRIYNKSGYWFVHAYHAACMGRCPCCQVDRYKKDQRIIRKKRKTELRRVFFKEVMGE